MRVPARALKYCWLAIFVAAIVGAALVLLPGRSSAHEGGYLDFTGPGSGYLEVPDNALLNPSGAITVEAWIYLNSYAGWGLDPNFTDCPMLVGKNWSGSYALALGCGGDVMDSFVNGIEKYEDTPTIPLQTWTHVAMTYDGATRRNYQDGQPVTEIDDLEGPIGDTDDALRIGDDVQWDRSPDGRIDDVRIWNVARTQAEIAAGMDGVDPATPGLVADWTFDNGSTTDETSGLGGTLAGDVQLAEDHETATPTATGGFRPNLPGDADCTGSVGISDAVLMLKERSGVSFTPIPTVCFPGSDPEDADCDGDDDVLDILAVLKYVAGLINLPASCPSSSPSVTPI
jgi:hypothetical protein